MSAPRIGGAGVTLTDGTVLVVGGLPSWGGEVELTTAETYDGTSGHWSPAGILAAPRGGFSLLALPDGGALVVGGALTRTVTEEGEVFHPHHPAANAERFDPVSRTWSPTKDVKLGGGTAVTMRDGRVLVVGGKLGRIYDPSTGTWSATKPIPDGRHDASALLLQDGSVLVGGGWSVSPDPYSTPSCPDANPQAWRFVPGS